MEVSPAKSLILSATIHGGSYFFIQPDFVNDFVKLVNVFCERYKPCKMVKKDALQVYLQGRLFLTFYTATTVHS